VQARLDERDMNRHITSAGVCVEEDLRRVEQAESDLARVMARTCRWSASSPRPAPTTGFVPGAGADAAGQNVVRSAALRELLTTATSWSDGPARAGRADDDAGPRASGAPSAAQKVDID